MLNNFGFNHKMVCDLMSKDHRTIQQNFTRLCIQWLSVCASSDYRYDERNADSHNVAKKIEDALAEYDGTTLEEIYLAFI